METKKRNEYHRKYRSENPDRCREIRLKSYNKMWAEKTCEIIKEHHEDMKDDPERLTTEFMKRIVNTECDD